MNNEQDNVPLLEARAEILKLKRENAMLKERSLSGITEGGTDKEHPIGYSKHKDTDYRTSAEGTTSRDVDYHDRLEQEVTSLKREVILLETQNTKLTHDLNGCHRQIHDLRLDNEQLRQAIAVLNDEPTNSL